MIKKIIATGLILLIAAILTGTVAAQQITHVVGPGETLASIALRYGVTVQSLASANNITNANYIYPGQVLVIPATGGPIVGNRTYVVQRGDELRFIAARFGVTWQSIAQLNFLANPNLIYPGQVLQIPGTGGPVYQPPPVSNGSYVVQPGDTLYRIGARFGVDIWNIARTNGLLNLNQIYVGQVLVIPGY